MHVTTKNRLF